MAANADNVIIGAATVTIDGADIGYTFGGSIVTYSPEYVDVIGDQGMGIIKKFRALEKMKVSLTMLEPTLDRMRIAFNQPSANLSGSTLNLGYSNSCSINEHVIELVATSENCGTRTFHFGTCVAVGEKNYQMMRDQEVRFEVEFEVLKDSNGYFGYVVNS